MQIRGRTRTISAHNGEGWPFFARSAGARVEKVDGGKERAEKWRFLFHARAKGRLCALSKMPGRELFRRRVLPSTFRMPSLP